MRPELTSSDRAARRHSFPTGSRRLMAGAACLLAGIFLVSSGCDLDPPTPPAFDAGSADFTRIVAVGASFTAGMQSRALVEDFQALSFPALLARQAGRPVGNAGFSFPNVGYPGIGPGDQPDQQIAILGIAALTSPCSPSIAPIAATPGAPTNTAFQGVYSNLAVPGASVEHLNLAPSLLIEANPFFNVVARPSAFEDRSIAQLAVMAQPTLLVVWAGMADALIGVTAAEPDAMLSSLAFQASLGTLIDTLATSGADMVMANLFDVTATPFVNALPIFLVDPAVCEVVTVSGQPVRLLGETESGTPGPLDLGARVTLGARSLLATGRGIPVAAGGTGEPLPDSVILTPSEVGAVRARIAEYNTIIESLASDRDIPLVDVEQVMGDLIAHGSEVAGIELTGAFITGGVFSLDGIHPTPVGHGLLAGAWIDVINARFGSTLPPIDLAALLAVSTLPEN